MSRLPLPVIFAVLSCAVLVPVGLLTATRSSSAQTAAAPAAATTAAPPAPQSAPAVSPDDPNQKLARTMEDFTSTTWTDVVNGCKMEREKTELRIHGTQDKNNWVNNGITSSITLPDGDFAISVDVKLVAPPAGQSFNRNAYIRVAAANQSAIGTFENDGALYSVQDWADPQVHSYTTSHFNGNNATDFHRLKLAWDNKETRATAWVDDKKIGSIITKLGPRRKLMLIANCDTQGAEFDFYFKNLKVELPPAPPASAPAALP